MRLCQQYIFTIQALEGLTLKQRLLLIKQLVGKSNREFAYMLEIFSMLSGIDTRQLRGCIQMS
jgi:transposase